MIFVTGQGGHLVCEAVDSRQSIYSYCIDVSDALLKTMVDTVCTSAAQIDVVHFQSIILHLVKESYCTLPKLLVAWHGFYSC